ncbi:GNAT family N-acetyltransferase [Paenibacillus sp. MBLB2552]|uniref:GNAT family N-acetyltransferase n=1 Tax=Paenibacillus mellifer TaxID=2937794 RepID=A0A9X1XXI7_9BACL|nr:GNAT family N-acetyltransferase [Paenibacillus mellifer]MCK8487410.1 GNAT family N-acetyltransferase [Paenibacillus mellifer]
MKIRLASLNDIEGIAKVHLESWKTTYKNIISDSYLSNITLEGRIRNWTWVFNNSNNGEVIYVIEDENNQIVGFLSGGKSRESNLEYEAELYAIYLLKDAQCKGYGRLLFNRFIEELKLTKYESIMLWVLKENPAINFYKKLGGEYITEKEIQIGEDRLIEIALGWKDI